MIDALADSYNFANLLDYRLDNVFTGVYEEALILITETLMVSDSNMSKEQRGTGMR